MGRNFDDYRGVLCSEGKCKLQKCTNTTIYLNNKTIYQGSLGYEIEDGVGGVTEQREKRNL